MMEDAAGVLACVGLDTSNFCRGDALLTRRAKARTRATPLVVRFSKSDAATNGKAAGSRRRPSWRATRPSGAS